MSPRAPEALSLFPKIVVTPTAEGNVRAWCGGCGTFAIVVGPEALSGFKQRHGKCPDKTERVGQ